MTRLALFLLLLATGASATENVIEVQHDSQRGVTCWILNGVGISCLSDSHIIQRRPQASVDEHQENPRPTGADARWNEERYSL